MIPLCPECSKFGEPAKLTISGKKLICEVCGFNYPDEFEEIEGMVLSKGTIELNPKADTTMYLKVIKNKNAKEASFALVETLPLEPFKNGRKVKEYLIRANYEIRVFYEDDVLGRGKANRP
jgi:hypothetical protein